VTRSGRCSLPLYPPHTQCVTPRALYRGTSKRKSHVRLPWTIHGASWTEACGPQDGVGFRVKRIKGVVSQNSKNDRLGKQMCRRKRNHVGEGFDWNIGRRQQAYQSLCNRHAGTARSGREYPMHKVQSSVNPRYMICHFGSEGKGFVNLSAKRKTCSLRLRQSVPGTCSFDVADFVHCYIF